MKNKGKLYSIALATLLLFFLIFGSSVALAGTDTTANGVYAYDLATGIRTDINGNYAYLHKNVCR